MNGDRAGCPRTSGCAAGGCCWAARRARGSGARLGQADQAIDGALAALYDTGRRPGRASVAQRSAGLGASAPAVARWLGDIRSYFPATVVQVMQRDAIDRLNLRQLLLEPELLESIQPDVHLVGTLLSLNQGHAGDDQGDRAAGGGRGRGRSGAAARQPDPGRGVRRAEPGRPVPGGRSRATSTGTGPSPPT